MQVEVKKIIDYCQDYLKVDKWQDYCHTEKLGIQNLGKLIAKKFKVKVDFIDVPCDV
ncbi:hypothetical protein KAR28_06155 [Candidatus Parcubacteria bacterium]|nr:hypothetical protein [Candidatus Parcubacteria bacterium]